MNPIVALIIANVIWGAASPIFKFSLTNIPPFTLAFIRFFFAALIFVPFVIGKWQKITLKDFFIVCLTGFFGITVNITFFFLGLERTTSINAPIIASAGPVFIYILSVIFLKEKPRLKVLTGMLIALTGVLAIVFSPIFFSSQKIGAGEVTGNLFFILATLGSVLQTILSKKISKRVNPYQNTFIAFVFGSLTFFPLMTNELHSWSFSSLNQNGWVGIIFGVIFSSAIAYFLYNFGLTKISAQESGVFTYIDPVAACFIAIPLLQEYPNAFFFIGATLVFGGILLAEGRVHWHPLHRLKKQVRVTMPVSSDVLRNT